MTANIWFPHGPSVAVAAFLTLLIAAGCSSDGGAPDLDDPAATGAELVNSFVLSAQEADIAELDEWLSDHYLSPRADGAPRDKAAVLADPVEINSFDVSDEIVAVQHGEYSPSAMG
jgi:hypothetical protein